MAGPPLPSSRAPAAPDSGVAAPGAPAPGGALHYFAIFTVGCTLLLIFAGGLVTSTGSGLAVPDWPLSFGQVFPEMKGGVLYEHSHRLIASFVGLLTLVLASWVVIREPRPFVRGLGIGAAVVVLVQGILGGVTVLYGLPPAVSVLHACLAQAFLCILTGLAVVTGPGWARRSSGAIDPVVRRLGVATAALVYGQLILGAVTRHTGAGLAIPSLVYPFGADPPSLASHGVQIHLLHRLGALAVFGIVAVLVARIFVASGAGRWLRAPAVLLAVLVAVQVGLGATTVLSLKHPLPTTLHVFVGAGLLATSVVLMLRAGRSLEAGESA